MNQDPLNIVSTMVRMEVLLQRILTTALSISKIRIASFGWVAVSLAATARITAYDPSTGHLWVHGTYGGSQLAEYDPVNDSWTRHGSGSYLELYATAAIDPERRLLVAVGWTR